MEKIHQTLRGNTKPESFFGKVISYGKSPEGADAVLVDVLDKRGLGSGQKRLIVMDMGANIELGEGKERPGIALYAKSGKSNTAPGGVLRIETAVQTGQVWKARWVAGAVHKPDQGSVFTGDARVGPLQVSATTKKPYRTLDVLNLDGAQSITSVDQLNAAIKAAILDIGAGNVMVRITTGASVSGSLLGGKGETPEARAEAVLANEKIQSLTKVLANGEQGNALVEIIPAKRFFFGGDSAKNPKLDKAFFNPSEDGSQQHMKGFRPLLITLMHHDDGAAFVTGVAFADSDGFKRYGRAADATAASAAAFPSPSASAPAEEPFDTDDLPDIDLTSMLDAADSSAARSSGPGMG